MYGKVLSGTGKRAVILLNRTGSAANTTVRWADLGLTAAFATVRNAWTAPTQDRSPPATPPPSPRTTRCC